MINKKEFIKLLITGGIIFFVAFGVCFFYFYYQGIKEPIVPKETIEVSNMIEESIEGQVAVQEQDRIIPTTKVWIQVVDDQYNYRTKKQVSTGALIGMTKEELTTRFEDHKLIQFDRSEVILQKQLEARAIPKTYSLVIQEGMLGILEKGEPSHFMSLGLSEDAFSTADLVLFGGQGLDITLKEKIQLQQQPYYIEQILQNYNE